MTAVAKSGAIFRIDAFLLVFRLSVVMSTPRFSFLFDRRDAPGSSSTDQLRDNPLYPAQTQHGNIASTLKPRVRFLAKLAGFNQLLVEDARQTSAVRTDLKL